MAPFELFGDVDRHTLETTLRVALLEDLMSYQRFFFYRKEGAPFIINWHHEILCEFLTKVLNGEITRGIINIPPGFTKTELAVKAFMGYGIAKYPNARFMHVSFSQPLALANSSEVKEDVNSEEFQSLWEREAKTDTKAKDRWFTKEGGGMMAAPTKGQITGFRAGRMVARKFTGALVVDDPLKPDDAYSDTLRNAANNRYNNTLRSRLALNNADGTPVIVIMQRLHENDLTGFLLKGGTGEKWDHLVIPDIIPEDGPWVFNNYPKKYTHGRPYFYEWESHIGPTWQFKMNEQTIADLKASDPYTYASQYTQLPAPLGKGMVKEAWWTYHHGMNETGDQVKIVGLDGVPVMIPIRYKMIYGDTAQKTEEQHDYSVFQCWAYGADGRIYLVDQIRGKWEAQDLEPTAKAFFDKHEANFPTNLVGITGRKVEDKASGVGLIQTMNSLYGAGYIEGIPRTKDKVTRVMGGIPYICQGKVVIPAHANYSEDYVGEWNEFSPKDTHDHDDQIDPTLDAIEEMLQGSYNIYAGAM